MAKQHLRLYANAAGVWRENGSGERFGLAWEEIEWVYCRFWEPRSGETAAAVGLYARNGGIGMELGGPGREADAPFLAEVAAALAARLGLPAEWHAGLQQAGPARRALVVWAREALPRVHADDRGLWCSELDQFTEWGRIVGIDARKGPDGALTIELDAADARPGDLAAIEQARPGFTECIRGIAVRLPGMPEHWLAEAERLPAGGAATVWHRTCPEGYPRLWADDLGLCREDSPDATVEVAWDAVERVLGRPRDGHTEIELETVDGIHILLRSEWQGFADVTEAMAAWLPDLSADRLGRVGALRPGHALWRRGWTIAGESLGPDGLLVTAWRRIDRPD
jgi:hypothetical protein